MGDHKNLNQKMFTGFKDLSQPHGTCCLYRLRNKLRVFNCCLIKVGSMRYEAYHAVLLAYRVFVAWQFQVEINYRILLQQRQDGTLFVTRFIKTRLICSGYRFPASGCTSQKLVVFRDTDPRFSET